MRGTSKTVGNSSVDRLRYLRDWNFRKWEPYGINLALITASDGVYRIPDTRVQPDYKLISHIKTEQPVTRERVIGLGESAYIYNDEIPDRNFSNLGGFFLVRTGQEIRRYGAGEILDERVIGQIPSGSRIIAVQPFLFSLWERGSWPDERGDLVLQTAKRLGKFRGEYPWTK
ncbi:MAG: hypothetical protein GF368_06060 [Candidatus Aenigmarchaeota archaeon]|nr:hypothetical protein [Candidatus Aenigmarchaeota archaeon]